jgi:hypothetical protein
MVFIIANVIVMGLDQDDQTKERIDLLLTLNYFFTVLFLLEAIVKILILGFKNYIHNSWNKYVILSRFDLFIVTASLIDVGVQ